MRHFNASANRMSQRQDWLRSSLVHALVTRAKDRQINTSLYGSNVPSEVPINSSINQLTPDVDLRGSKVLVIVKAYCRFCTCPLGGDQWTKFKSPGTIQGTQIPNNYLSTDISHEHTWYWSSLENTMLLLDTHAGFLPSKFPLIQTSVGLWTYA